MMINLIGFGLKDNTSDVAKRMTHFLAGKDRC